MRVLTEKRQELILNQLKKEKIVTNQDLISQLNISESTVRRDLASLEEAGKLVRVHGGAKLAQEMTPELNMAEKSVKNRQAKQKVAQAAAQFVRDGDQVYIDAGTTTLELIPYLKDKAILAVTNGVTHAQQLLNAGIETIILGGQAKLNTQAIIGSTALRQLENYHFSHVFLGINSIDANLGLTTPDSEEATIKKQAAASGERIFVLADASKFNKVSFHKVLDLDKCMIITDRLSSDLSARFENLTTLKEVD